MAIRTEAIAQIATVRWVRTQDWLTLLLVGSTVIAVVRSVEVARWVPTPWLLLTAALGALAGFWPSACLGRLGKGTSWPRQRESWNRVQKAMVRYTLN